MAHSNSQKYSLIKEEVVLTLKEAVDSAKAEAEDDLKAYVDSLFSNEKTEIMEGVEKAKEDTILELKSIESSILSVVEENKNEILSNNEILESSLALAEFEIASNSSLYESLIIDKSTIKDNKKYTLVKRKNN